jgi:hypothetical protein
MVWMDWSIRELNLLGILTNDTNNTRRDNDIRQDDTSNTRRSLVVVDSTSNI